MIQRVVGVSNELPVRAATGTTLRDTWTGTGKSRAERDMELIADEGLV